MIVGQLGKTQSLFLSNIVTILRFHTLELFKNPQMIIGFLNFESISILPVFEDSSCNSGWTESVWREYFRGLWFKERKPYSFGVQTQPTDNFIKVAG